MLEHVFAMALWASKALCLIALLLILLGLDLDKRWRLRHIPGPPALPFLGNLAQIIRQGSPTFFRECRAKYGPVFRIAFGRNWTVVVAEPELLRQVGTRVLNHSLFRTLMRGDFCRLDDLGLLAAKDDYWRLVRTAWQPAFSAASLSGYLPRMVACAGQLAERLAERAAAAAEVEAAAGGGAGPGAARVDIWRELGAMTLQVVGSTAYGVDFHAMDSAKDDAGIEAVAAADAVAVAASSSASANCDPRQRDGGGGGGQYGRVLVEACRDFFRYSSIVYGSKYSRVSLLLPELRPLVSAVAHAVPDLPFAKLLQARKNLLVACVSLIDAWKAPATSPSTSSAQSRPTADASPAVAAVGLPVHGEQVNGAASAASTPADGGAKAPAVAVGSFLGLMLSARDKASGEALSDMQVAAQVQTFILAGYETTANGLAFAVYCIATNPEVEARLVAEIDSVLGSDRAPTEADLPRLSYTEAVFNEAMRLFPPAHATNRADDKNPLQVGGHTVPPGTPLFLSIFSSHHNPDVWPRAADFIPERYLPDSPLHPEVCARVPYAHSPFGYGSRMCIGWKFAVQEAKVALAALYQRLRFELEPGQVPLKTQVGITLSPRHGVWVRPVLRRRTHATVAAPVATAVE